MALIAHYPLNGDTKDYSGYGNDAVNHGAVEKEEGKIGNCYSFNGVNSSMEYKDKLGGVLDTKDKVSLAVWVRPDEVNTAGYFLTKNDTNYGDIQYGFLVQNGRFQFTLNGTHRAFSNYRPTVGEWVHVSCVYDGLTAKIYVNGLLDVAAPYTGNLLSSSWLSIGNRRSSSVFFKGLLNDIRIYDHALSDKEVKEIAKAKVLHYKFDEQDLTTKIVKDCSGFGNDGTVAVTTAPSWSEDSPVGRGSMEFDGSTFIETTKSLSIGKNPFTVNSWFKPQRLTTYSHIFTASNQNNFACKVGVLPNSAPYFYVGGAVNTGTSSTIPRLEVGNWYMLTYTYDGESIGIFINAVLVNTVAPSVKLDIPTTKFRVQNWGTEYGKGLQSDLRVYATALSPEDILELYQTRASIDNLGNLFVHKIDEINNTSKEVDSRGIARFNEFNEVGGENKVSIKNDGVVYVNEIMEA